MKFSHPVLVLSALKLARQEPAICDVPQSLVVTLVECVEVGLVAERSRLRGRHQSSIYCLTDLGSARVRAATVAAQNVAAGL